MDNLFGILTMSGTHAQRVVKNTKRNTFTLDTARVTDRALPYETAVAHKDFNDGDWIVLEWSETKEEAEFEVERLKVIAELKEFAEPDDRKWNSLDYHCSISYNHNKGGFDIDAWSVMKSDSIHFESKDKAREAIKAVGEDRIKKYYLRVKE